MRAVALLCLFAAISLVVGPLACGFARTGQAPADDLGKRLDDAARLAERSIEEAKAKTLPGPQQVEERISVFDLYWQGGPLMVPITLMSLVVVTFGLERWLGLRRRRVLPPDLVKGLEQLLTRPNKFDPRAAQHLCRKHPSPAATIVGAVLLQTGRPRIELEDALSKATEREADKLYSHVRWLNLSATVTPLMGLLGTVQGMIMAFFVTAHLPPGQNRALQLAQGIYVALVTTFGGLTVAIPAAMLAHYFEGRIQKLFGELDETIVEMFPLLEPYRDKVIASHDASGELNLESSVVGPAAQVLPGVPRGGPGISGS